MENLNNTQAEDKSQNLLHDALSGIDKSTVIKYALIGGGVVLGTYLVSKWLFSEDKNKKNATVYVPKVPIEYAKKQYKEESILNSPIAQSIKASVSAYLISLAKEKIIDYISQKKSNSAKEAIQPTS